MAQIMFTEPTKEDAGITEQSGSAYLALAGPARGAVGRDVAGLASPPERTRYSGSTTDEAARTGDRAGTSASQSRRMSAASASTRVGSLSHANMNGPPPMKV